MDAKSSLKDHDGRGKSDLVETQKSCLNTDHMIEHKKQYQGERT